jgi:serine/threonine-protein kinase
VSNWVGKRLGRVQIESLVGRGGVAEVYLGTHTTLQRKVAVKILRNLNEENTDALERFEREARVIARLRHPNIVQVHDFDTIGSDPYLVMEYIEGPSLSQYLRVLHENNKRIPPPDVIRLISAVASALQYAHNNGVIHRDIKPGNILLTSASGPVVAGKPLPEDFEPVLTDFGLVRFLDGNRQTSSGHIAGTPAYMSPEQARGDLTDGRTDVYSLGIVLYEILAGHVPFDGETTVSILLKQVNEAPPPIQAITPFIENVLSRALAKDAKDRFQTPMELANAFRAAVELILDPSTIQLDSFGSDAATLTLEPPPEAPAPSSRPRWMRVGLLATLALAMAGILIVRGLPSSPAAAPSPTAPASTDTLAPATDTPIPPTEINTQPVPLVSGPAGILRFQDAAATLDQASLIVRSMPAPPPGSQYEIWLTGDDDRISLGVFSPDQAGQGQLVFTQPEGLNLLAGYDRVEITIEPRSDSDAGDSGLIAYSFSLPAESLLHIRYLLVAFPRTPEKNGLIHGLLNDLVRINVLVREMQNSYEADDTPAALAKAEEALNLLVGPNSPDFKDWTGDGQTLARNTTYGLLVNGSNFGYLQAVFAEAEVIVNTSGSTQYMVENGNIVRTCTQNLSPWAAQLRDLLVTILTSTLDSEISEAINEAVVVAEQMLNGADLDNDDLVANVPGECGAEAIYQHAYYMADMPVLPVSISYQLTVVANPSYIPPTKRPDGNTSQNGGTLPNARATKTPRPDNPNRPPAKTDKPPKDNNPPGQSQSEVDKKN